MSSSSKCEIFDKCDSGSDTEDSLWISHFSLVLSQSCEIARKDNFSCPSVFRGDSMTKKRKMSNG